MIKPRTPNIRPIVIVVAGLAILACNAGRVASGGAANATSTASPVTTPQSAPTVGPTAPATAEPSAGTATASPTALIVSSPTPTTAQLQLEIIETQIWTDYQGNARLNVLLRNPYEFPVRPAAASATLLNSAGEFIRSGNLYFLDGISGGSGFLLPGETVAANVCFTCEEALLSEEWASAKFVLSIQDATDAWNYFTEVEATITAVSFNGDSPIFNVSGTVKNNSDSALARISVRTIVFDQEGKLVGAAEVSAWEVGPGATASISGYGIGQTPAGPVTYEVTALGVNY